MPVDNRVTPEELEAAQVGDATALVALQSAVAAKQDSIPPGTYVGPAAPVTAATAATVVGSAKVTGDATDRFRVQADGTLDFGTPGNLSSRQKLYPTPAGLESDHTLTIRREVTGGTEAPEIILRAKASDGSFPFWLSGAIDIANTIKGRDLVIAAKGDYPAPGNVTDFVVCPHNGTEVPGFGVGGWPPDNVATSHFQINASDLTKVTMRVGFVTNQTGDVLRVGGPNANTLVIAADTTTTLTTATAFKVQSVGLTELLKVDQANNLLRSGVGLVGLGPGATGTPTATLDVIQTGTANVQMKVRTASWGIFSVLCLGANPGTVSVGTTNGTPMNLQTNGADRIKIGASGELGFFGTTAIAKPTGVAVDAAGIHAALVSLGLIAA